MKFFQVLPHLWADLFEIQEFKDGFWHLQRKESCLYISLLTKSHLFILFFQQRAELVYPAHHATLLIVHCLHEGVSHVRHQEAEAEECVSLSELESLQYISQAHSYAVYKTNINFNMYTVYTRTNERLEMVLYFIFREARWQWRWRVPFALTNDIINEDTVMYMARRPKDSVRFDI